MKTREQLVVAAMTRATDQKLTAVSIEPDALMQLYQAYSDYRTALEQIEAKCDLHSEVHDIALKALPVREP